MPDRVLNTLLEDGPQFDNDDIWTRIPFAEWDSLR